MHLDAGHDSGETRDLLTEIGCDAAISKKGVPLLAICTERRTRVVDAFISLVNAVIILRRLLRTAWTS